MQVHNLKKGKNKEKKKFPRIHRFFVICSFVCDIFQSVDASNIRILGVTLSTSLTSLALATYSNVSISEAIPLYLLANI